MTFCRSDSNPDASTMMVGPLYLIAHKSGHWSVELLGTMPRGWKAPTGKAKNQREAQRSALNAARGVVGAWSSAFDEAAEELR